MEEQLIGWKTSEKVKEKRERLVISEEVPEEFDFFDMHKNVQSLIEELLKKDYIVSLFANGRKVARRHAKLADELEINIKYPVSIYHNPNYDHLSEDFLYIHGADEPLPSIENIYAMVIADHSPFNESPDRGLPIKYLLSAMELDFLPMIYGRHEKEPYQFLLVY